MRRREFLASLGAAAVTAALPSRALALTEAMGDDGTLLVIELAGGNDGLNSVIPFADDRYHRARPTLAVSEDRVLKLDDVTALHPELASLRDAWDAGELAVVQGVGYPEPNRSHSRSMDIWQSAIPDRVDTGSGWIGRTLARAKGAPAHDLFVLGGGPTPLAFRGAPFPVITISSLDDLVHRGGADRRQRLREVAMTPRRGDDLEFLRKSTLETTDVSARIARARDALKQSRGPYPGTPFAHQLRLAAALLRSGFERSVMWVRLAGFDTHARQDDSHPTLLRVLGRAVGAFREDLRTTPAGRRTTVAVFTEFGRRVAENASRGTDHGAAGPMLVLGRGVKGGVVGAPPDLGDLDDGDVRHAIDLRSVWAALSRSVLGEQAAVKRVTTEDPGLFRS